MNQVRSSWSKSFTPILVEKIRKIIAFGWPRNTHLSSILRSLPTKPVFKRILTKAFCQYILNLMSKKKLGSFNDLIINTCFQSFICLPRYRYEHFLASIFCKVSLALQNRIQPILERLNENITKPRKPSIIDRSNKWY